MGVGAGGVSRGYHVLQRFPEGGKAGPGSRVGLEIPLASGPRPSLLPERASGSDKGSRRQDPSSVPRPVHLLGTGPSKDWYLLGHRAHPGLNGYSNSQDLSVHYRLTYPALVLCLQELHEVSFK